MPAPLRSRLPMTGWWRLVHGPTPQGLLLLNVLVTLGFLVAGCVVLLTERQDAVRQADETATDIAVGVEQDVARNIELFDQSLLAVSDGLQLPGIWELTPELRNMVLFERVAKARYFGFVNALNEAGDVIADSHFPQPRGGSYAGRDYFIALKRDPRNILFIGRPILTGADQPGSITLSRRMSHPDGSFAGVVVGSMQLAYVRDLFGRLDIGPNGMITLLHNDGVILMRRPFNGGDVGRSVDAGSSFRTFQRTREAHIDGVVSSDDRARRFTYRQIGDLPLAVGVGLANEDVYAAWWSRALVTASVLIALCACNAVLSVVWFRRQRKLTESESNFRQITENVGDIVTRVDRDGVCTYVSPATWRVLGLAPEKLRGHHFANDVHPDDRAGFEVWLARLRDDAVEALGQFRMRHQDGSDVWIEAVGRRLEAAGSDGRRGFAILSRDVTAHRRLERVNAERMHDLERTNAELEDLSCKLADIAQVSDAARDAKASFLATMSHEVRNSLNCILGCAAQLAAEGQLDPVQAGTLNVMRGAGQHLRNVLDRALDAVRAEAQAMVVRLERNDLPVLLEQARAEIEPTAREKNLAIRCEIDRDVPHAYVTDATLLRQIVLNLLHNAVKFTQRGEVVLRVTQQDGRLRCCVVDTGSGVRASERSRLFQEYVRLENDRTITEGTGLGLAIVQRLAKALGGTCGFADNPSGGSIFWVDLPIGAMLPEVPGPPSYEAVTTRTLRVLVVDDSETNRDVAAYFLRAGGHVVLQAPGGRAAVHQVADEDVDVVLMDMHMPQMDGVETSRRIRALPGRRGRVAIIAVTAQVLDDRQDAWRAAGIDRFLAKPYEQRELLAAVALAAPSQPAVVTPALENTANAADTLAELVAALGSDTVDGHLRGLADHVGTLLAALRHQDDSGDPEALAELVHRIAGDAGQLGFAALAITARAFMAALDRQPEQMAAAAANLQEAAARAEDALHQRLSASRKASMVSTKLP